MNNDDPRLNTLIKEGGSGDIVIVGVPFDYSRKRTIHKEGEENGPCCLRRFYHKVGPIINPEYNINISKVNVSDYGNISLQNKNESMAPERAINNVTKQVQVLLRNNQLPFVLGGAKEGTYGTALACGRVHQGHRHILITGRPTLRRPYDQNKLSSDNLMTMLMRQPQYKLTLFGTSTHYFPQQYERNFDIVSYQNIRSAKWQENQQINTQAGFVMSELLQNLNEEQIHVTISVEVIERFRGCRDVQVLGLTVEQMVEIMMLFGVNKKVSLVDICEFNPSVEDYQSSLLILNLLYYFIMGYSQRI